MNARCMLDRRTAISNNNKYSECDTKRAKDTVNYTVKTISACLHLLISHKISTVFSLINR